jgi:hypothetical protein
MQVIRTVRAALPTAKFMVAAVTMLATASCGRAPAGASEVASTPPTILPAASASLALVPEAILPDDSVLFRVGDKVLLIGGQEMSVVSGEDLERLDASGLPLKHASAAIGGATEADLVAAESDGSSVSVYRSGDGGVTWKALATVPVETYAGLGTVSVAVKDTHLVVVVNQASGSATSIGTVLVSDDDGATWRSNPAPVGGTVSAAGDAFWLVGGVIGDDVFRSEDGVKWDRIKIPATVKYWTAGPATSVSDAGVVLPVTATDPDAGGGVTFWASSDAGQSWRALSSVDLEPAEFDSPVPADVRADGHWVVMTTDGSRVFTGTLGDAGIKKVSPSGLLENVWQVEMTSTNELIVIASTDECPSGKTSCSSALVLVVSDDGGQTWTPARQR